MRLIAMANNMAQMAKWPKRNRLGFYSDLFKLTHYREIQSSFAASKHDTAFRVWVAREFNESLVSIIVPPRSLGASKWHKPRLGSSAHRQEDGVAARGGGVDGNHPLQREASQIVRPARLGPGAG